MSEAVRAGIRAVAKRWPLGKYEYGVFVERKDEEWLPLIYDGMTLTEAREQVRGFNLPGVYRHAAIVRRIKTAWEPS